MANRARFVWQRRILIGLIAAVSSFLISLILPWKQHAEPGIPVSTIHQLQNLKKGSQISGDGALAAQQNDAFAKLLASWEEEAKAERLTFSVPKEFQGKTVEEVKLNPKEKVIALTFDDGPYPSNTEGVLKILKKNNIKGTFFWIGKNVKAYPELAQQVVADGHAIGNHTWHHWYREMSEDTASHEIEDTAELIYKTTGVRTSLFRPPGGFLHNGVADYAKKKNYLITMWTADSIDYSRPGIERLINNVMKEVKPGGMVLMHDGGGDRSQTVAALPKVIDKLRNQGYKFVTVPELFEMEDKEQQATTAVKPTSSDVMQNSLIWEKEKGSV